MEILAREIREGDALVDYGYAGPTSCYSDVASQDEYVVVQFDRYQLALPAGEYVQVKP